MDPRFISEEASPPMFVAFPVLVRFHALWCGETPSNRLRTLGAGIPILYYGVAYLHNVKA